MRLLLLLNPAASAYDERDRDETVRRLSRGHELEVAETHGRGHARELAADAARHGTDVVVVLAGDGTLNEAASGVLKTRTALAPLPGGSTNVLARTLGIPANVPDAAEALVASLDAGSELRVGVGIVRERCFLFCLGAGFDAAVVARIEQRPAVKRHLAHPAFAVTALDTWLRRSSRAARISVSLCWNDGREADAGAGPYAVVSNSSPYTYAFGRPIRVSSYAALDRALALTLVRTLRPGVLGRAAASAFRGGDFVTSCPEISQAGHLAEVRLTAEQPFPWQVDGEFLGLAEHLEARYEPGALALVVPSPGEP